MYAELLAREYECLERLSVMIIARSLVLRYGVAVGCSVVALILTDALPDRIERHVSAIFFAGVMLSAWYGGLGPGLLATTLSTLGRWYFLIPPVSSAEDTINESIRLTLFAAVAVVISYLNEARKRAEQRHIDLLIREKVARSKAEATEGRYLALSEAARILTSSRDPEKTVASIANLAVPRFADSCVVDLLSQDGLRRRVAEGRRGGARAESTADPPRAEAEELAAKGLRVGRPGVTPVSVIVPLVVGGRTLGAMSFWLTGSDRQFGSDDTTFAQELSRFAALALDRGRTIA